MVPDVALAIPDFSITTLADGLGTIAVEARTMRTQFEVTNGALVTSNALGEVPRTLLGLTETRVEVSHERTEMTTSGVLGLEVLGCFQASTEGTRMLLLVRRTVYNSSRGSHLDNVSNVSSAARPRWQLRTTPRSEIFKPALEKYGRRREHE